MAIFIKNDDQLDKMRKAGHIVAKTHAYLKEIIAPGITTKEIDRLAKEFIENEGAYPTFHLYQGFPGYICVSVNDEVIHGIGSNRILQEGDIVGLDIGATIDGFVGDAARTLPVGNVSGIHQKLIDVTEVCFFKGIEYAKEGHRLYEISKAIYEYVTDNGFSVVRDFVGHGVGQELHEDPQIPNYPQIVGGPRLKKGMTLAIEPMVNVGGLEVKVLEDDWTVVTVDGSFSSHYENTIAITDGNAEILTIL